MGYSTTFLTRLRIEPPLDAQAVSDLNQRLGSVFEAPVGGSSIDDNPAAVLEPTSIPVPAGAPGWRCGWQIGAAGDAIVWDGVEKFLDGADWLAWLLQGPLADRRCHGVAFAIGETLDWFDLWRVDVGDGVVARRYRVPSFAAERWDDFEEADDYLPDHFHTAMYSLDQPSTAERELRAFFAGLTAEEVELGRAVGSFVLDVVEAGIAPESLRAALPS